MVAPDDLLHDLDEGQRRAVTSAARPLAIVAPAGSGKTRVLTRRIAWRVASGDADASHVLALTFTRRAAGELRDRLAALGLRSGVAAGTFHGVALAQLRARWADEGRTPPGLLARKGSVLGGVVAGAPVSVSQLASEIEWAKARLVGPDGYAEAVAAARRRTPTAPDRVAALYRAYEDEKNRARLVDFDDLLRACSHALETDPAFAAAQRWRFQHLFVDEFQDVNPLQLALLDAWRGTSTDLCVVGDPHQAIYGWNGADAGFLTGFRRLYPSADVVVLDGNYRSTPQILGAAADVLRRAGVEDRTVRAARHDGPRVRLDRHPNDRAEAVAVARAVRDGRTPRTPWSAQAVLLRTHAQIEVIAEALRGAGIPYRVRGGESLLDRPAVRAAVDLLRRSPGPLTTCLPDLDALADGDGDAGGGGAGRGGAGGGEDRNGDGGAAEAITTLVRLAHDHLRIDPGATSSGFVAWLVATLQSEGGDDGRDAVTIATFHAAKGLEWPVVHLAGLEDGLVPITHAAHARPARGGGAAAVCGDDPRRRRPALHLGRRAHGRGQADRAPAEPLAPGPRRRPAARSRARVERAGGLAGAARRPAGRAGHHHPTGVAPARRPAGLA